METIGPHVRTIPVRCAPAKPPVPRAASLGNARPSTTAGSAPSPTSRSSSSTSPTASTGPVATAARHSAPPRRASNPGRCTTTRSVQAVLDRILEDGMSVERVIASMRRDFLLDLSDGFVYDCLDWQVRRLDLADHRRWVLDRFSGTLCVDELHLGQMTLLLATDPLQDLPVAFALVASNDQPHMRRFLKNLKTWGLSPEVVVTDGSNLYPTILAELWPDARHQLCVFHVLKDLHEQVLDAVRRQRRAMSRRGNRGRQAEARAAAQGPGRSGRG